MRIRLSRPPRRTVRFRLTVLYCGLFLAAGAGLLAITYVLVDSSTSVGLADTKSGKVIAAAGAPRAHPRQVGRGKPTAGTTEAGSVHRDHRPDPGGG